jgi:hypothetical protein
VCSSDLSPLITPPVEVSGKFYDDRNIDICVSTQGNNDQHAYYLWSYKEDWEIHALLWGQWAVIQVMDENTGKWVYKTVPNNTSSPDNRYNCWRKDSSNVYLLGTTEKLSENTIRERRILTISNNDDRISVLYRIIVKQHALHKEAYDYFNNQKKNSELTGSIFGSVPSELMGNIRCTSNPDMPVIGYVDVSTASCNDLFVTNDYFDSRERDQRALSCRDPENIATVYDIPPDGIIHGWVLFQEPFGFIPQSCVDCTFQGGSKRKPENWPNDHQ